jgi:hypothetical protein
MNNQPPAPYERFAYAVVMDGGWYVGIWKELETAELVAGKHPKGTVVPMTKFASGVESEKGTKIECVRPAGPCWLSACEANGQCEYDLSPQPAAEGTPRTDGRVFKIIPDGLQSGTMDVVDADLARTLERELADMTACAIRAQEAEDKANTALILNEQAAEKLGESWREMAEKLNVAEAALAAAARDEREACAEIAEMGDCDQTEYNCETVTRIAIAIRARAGKVS